MNWLFLHMSIIGQKQWWPYIAYATLKKSFLNEMNVVKYAENVNVEFWESTKLNYNYVCFDQESETQVKIWLYFIWLAYCSSFKTPSIQNILLFRILNNYPNIPKNKRCYISPLRSLRENVTSWKNNTPSNCHFRLKFCRLDKIRYTVSCFIILHYIFFPEY